MSEEIEYLSQEEIDQAEKILQGSKTYYVYFNDDGEILAIVKEPNNWAKNVLEVDEENVIGFLKGEKTTYTYKINKPALKSNAIITSNQLNKFSKTPLQVINNSLGNEDLIVIYNNDSKSWKIKLENTSLSEADLNKKIDLYVVLKDNHNFLLNTITFKMLDANSIEFKFKSNFENNFDSIDLLTKKIFNSYGKRYESNS